MGIDEYYNVHLNVTKVNQKKNFQILLFLIDVARSRKIK